MHSHMPYYASVGRAPEAYGSRRVCLSVCISKSCFSAMLENYVLKLVLQVKHAIPLKNIEQILDLRLYYRLIWHDDAHLNGCC